MDFPKSVPGVGLVSGKFVDEDSSTGQVGSLIPAAWANAITDEMINAITAAGLAPDEDDKTQLRQALEIIANRATAETVNLVEGPTSYRLRLLRGCLALEEID